MGDSQDAGATPPATDAGATLQAASRPDHSGDEAALSDAAAELDAVEAVLDRLERGTFDRCEVCGAPIGQDRLLEDPLLTRCPTHAGPSTAAPATPAPAAPTPPPAAPE